MNILFVTYDIPYPLDSGGKSRAYHLIDCLSKKHAVTLVSFFRRTHQLTYLHQLQKICKRVISLKRRSVFSFRNLAFINRLPYPAALYYSSSAKKTFDSLVKTGSFDLIHYESFYTSIFLDKSYAVPQIIGTENIEWKIYQDYANKQHNRIFRTFLGHEANRMMRYEIDTWQRADHVIGVSADNAADIEKATGRQCSIVPNGVDTASFAYKSKRVVGKSVNILFVGNFNYIQNIDAVEWLLSAIWPAVHAELAKKGLEGQLTIAGYNSSRFNSARIDHVTIVEKIADMRTLYYQADCLLAPIRIGSGTKFKVLEAMACGLPVITTGVGIEGIESGDAIAMVSDSVDGLVRHTVKLMTDDTLRKKLTAQARRVIQQTFDWQHIGSALEKAYERTLNHYRQL